MSKKKVNYNQITPEDINKLPGPLYKLIDLYNNEKGAFRKVHRLIDALEWAVKWHTILAVSDLLREAELTPKMKILLAVGLKTPSLGRWNEFFREAIAGLQNPSFPFSEEERLTSLEQKHMIVAFRNGYAHGATPEETTCLKDCKRMEIVFNQLIASKLFSDISLAVADNEKVSVLKGSEILSSEIKLEQGHTAAILPDGKILDLWPLGMYVEDSEKTHSWNFFYFNAIKSNKIEQLNYEYALLLRDKSLYDIFHKVLPLKEWGKANEPELQLFRSRIEALTENFRGRQKERKQIKEFCLNSNKALVIWGVPGIGKSALMAQTFKEMRAGIPVEDGTKEEVYPPVIEYFIRRGQEFARTDEFLRTINRRLDKLYSLKDIPMGNSDQEMWEGLSIRLNEIDEKLDRKDLVLFIDGLDESPDILRFIPEPREWLKVIVSGRRVDTVTVWERNWAKEGKSNLEVGPLGLNDIRSLLYEVTDKYQEGFTKAYVEAVANRSQGNPQYLKLLCENIFSAGGTLSPIDSIPTSMETLYEESLKRITSDGKDEDSLALLHLLTESKASLSVPVIAEFLGINSQRAKGALDRCMELLYEDPLTPDVDDYQLFHESLREWLRSNHKKECRVMASRLSDLCFNYSEREDELALEYALINGAKHLSYLGDHERLWLLLKDEEYRARQVDIFKNYRASYKALQEGINLYIGRNEENPADDGRLCWFALRAGDLAYEAKTDIKIAFKWAKERSLDDLDRIPDVLQRLEVLDEVDFFKSGILLLWIEADRQSIIPWKKRNPYFAQMIIDAVNRKIPENRGIVVWSDFLSDLFMAWWIQWILEVFPLDKINNLSNFIAMTDNDGRKLSSFIEYLPKNVSEDVIKILMNLSEKMEGEFKSASLVGIIEALTKNGLYGQAIDTLDKITDDMDKLRAYKCIAVDSRAQIK